MTELPKTLRADPLWKDTLAVVEQVYGKIDELIAKFPDENYNTASKLRNAANDSLFYLAQGVGGFSGEAREYDWNSAHKNLFTLQTMYIFATKQNLMELEPSIVVTIDKILTTIHDKLIASQQEVAEHENRDLAPWLEKYRIWQAMQEK